MPENPQTTTQLHSSHTLTNWCLKFSKPVFNSIWTVNFQMFQLDLGKAEEPEIKFPTLVGSSKKQELCRKTSPSALLTMPKSLTVWITTNWIILQEMEIPDYLICLLRNMHAGQEATVKTRHRKTDLFQIGKGVCQGCILSPCLFNLHAEYIMRNAGLDEAQAVIKIAGGNINNLRYADDTTLMAESEGKLKSPLMKVKEESEKVGLKPNIQKMKIKASGPITLWQIDGETVGPVTDFIFWGLKITADGDSSHEIKRHLLLGRKPVTNLDSILKSRDMTLSTKVHLVKAVVFPVVMYGCESWTIKKAECWRIDASELWCWRRLLRVPWTARRSNQSILKEISPGHLLEGLILKLKLPYFGHLMWRTDSFEIPWCWQRLKEGEEGDDRGWDGWMASWTRWTWASVNSGSWWWTGRPGVLQSIKFHGPSKSNSLGILSPFGGSPGWDICCGL